MYTLWQYIKPFFRPLFGSEERFSAEEQAKGLMPRASVSAVKALLHIATKAALD